LGFATVERLLVAAEHISVLDLRDIQSFVTRRTVQPRAYAKTHLLVTELDEWFEDPSKAAVKATYLVVRLRSGTRHLRI
jgi:hypothetical protein